MFAKLENYTCKILLPILLTGKQLHIVCHNSRHRIFDIMTIFKITAFSNLMKSRREEVSEVLTNIRSSINLKLIQEINMTDARNIQLLNDHQMVASKSLKLLWFTVQRFDGVTILKQKSLQVLQFYKS